MPGPIQLDPFSEEARGLRKRNELKKKLEQKQKEQGLVVEPEKTPEELEEIRRLAEVKAKEIEDEMNKGKPVEKPKVVKIGGKSVLTTEGGELSAEEARHISSICNAGKAGKVKAFAHLEGVNEVLDESKIGPNTVLMFMKCNNCEFAINTHCTKIFVEHCKGLILRLNGKIITETVELNRCEETNVVVNTKVGTMQVDQSRRMNIMYLERVHFHGYVIWAGCFLMQIRIGEKDIMRCDFGLTAQFDQSVNLERTQFKVWYGITDKLVCDKVVRLQNGFPTTKREDDEFLRKQEQCLDGLADRMGITVARDKNDIGNRIKPNDPCTCGSGKKYKKCCKT